MSRGLSRNMSSGPRLHRLEPNRVRIEEMGQVETGIGTSFLVLFET